MSAVVKLLQAVRQASGYAKFHEWEAAADHDAANRNYPFKPQSGFDDVGRPTTDDDVSRADAWDGSFVSWSSALKQARVGHVIDFYVTKVGDELVTNIEVWIASEKQAFWSECGGKNNSLSHA